MSAAKYYIYRNLHTGGFSVKRRGHVIDRLKYQSLMAEDVTFKVNEAGRQRVIKDKKKNVHAFIVCDKYELYGRESVDNARTITYNPYTSSSFTCDGVPITKARKIVCRAGKCYLLEK
jgi:hypothetical protein